MSDQVTVLETRYGQSTPMCASAAADKVSELGMPRSLRRPYSKATYQGQVDRRTLRATMLAP